MWAVIIGVNFIGPIGEHTACTMRLPADLATSVAISATCSATARIASTPCV